MLEEEEKEKENELEKKKCKLVFIGDSGVGKTSIIYRFIRGTFENNVDSTNGATFANKKIEYKEKNIILQFDIWDTAGQEKYRALTKIFYKDAGVAILVYDITRRESFDEIKNYWYHQIKDCAPSNIVLGIAANKCDLYDNEQVSEEEARKFADEIGAVFKLTSASTNTGIEELFKGVGCKVLDPNYVDDNDPSKKDNHIILDDGKDNKTKKKKACC